MRRESVSPDAVLRRLAHRQLADYDARSPGSMFAEGDSSLSVEEAYRLQIEVARLRQERGEAITGYKIGCVSRTIQRQLGIDHPSSATYSQARSARTERCLRSAHSAISGSKGNLRSRLRKISRVWSRCGTVPTGTSNKSFP